MEGKHTRPDGQRRPQQTSAPRRPRTAAEARAMREQRRRAQRRARLIFFGTAFAIILLISWPIAALIDHFTLPSAPSSSQSADASSPESASGSSASDPSGQDVSGGDGEASGTQDNSAYGPVQGDPSSYTMPTAASLALPENGRVDMAYFDDALFIGDSLTQGILTYKAATFENATYAAYIGVGPKELLSGAVVNINGESVVAMDEIRAANASKVYILLGTNSLVSYDDESLLHYYDEFLTLLESELPAGTTYYVQAIPPFSADKAAQSEEYSNERIRNLNEQIALMAYARGWHYLDLYSALADENGDQRADYSAGDGVHLNEAGYTAWREFLITHTAYDKDSPYIAGSPYLIS